ncbi:protein lin-54 homolog isoform X2 [Maniola jurtina]|uniref:protein lin-54 homolog isoform X2 n=1 Tax=Maniola jurtina TaxID=191418 RepID=UPI001E68933E|nr:protein lin-54 homolog isoform X2 [Maniola jurtina]
MDHNLDDSLNLESAMGVDFEQPEDIVVSEAGMSIEATPHEQSIPMEFEHTEEQPILMDTTNEEIIVSEFMGDQFTLQEYSVQSDQTTGLTTTVESNQQQILASQSDTMIDIQYQPQLVSTVKTDMLPPKLITVKNVAAARPVVKKAETALAPAPRQVAIAPKLPKLVATKTYTPPKQLPIAPKPMNMPSNRAQSLVKVSIANVVQGTTKGNSVLAQIGKQLIMVPSGSQKIKLVSPTGSVPNIQYVRPDSDQAQLIANKNLSGTQSKPVMAKLFAVQGPPKFDPSNQPAVITKIMPVGSGKIGGTPRFVALPPKNVPISFGNKVLMATPSTQGLVKLAKKQEIITIKSPTAKLLPAPALVPVSSGPTKSKVLQVTNTTKNVVFKPVTPTKATEVTNDGIQVIENQKSQLHQISVPGKGVQYVRLYKNLAPKAVPKAVNSKTFVLTDSKGNIIQMTAEKMTAGQPPSLVVTSNANTSTTSKPQHKLVRIAPVGAKTTQAATQPGRSSQSLLAPISPVHMTTDTSLPEIKTLLEEQELVQSELTEEEAGAEAALAVEAIAKSEDLADGLEEVDSKTALRQLIENTVAEDENLSMTEVEIEFKQQPHSPVQDNSMDSMEQHESSSQSEEQRLIMLPTKYEPEQTEITIEAVQDRMDDSQQMDNTINMDDEAMTEFDSKILEALNDQEAKPSDFGLRPRKACNCTKSQCLKLYCDCFANGEFCNRCNCINCHNNLENEELRQKAIRGCLDRNPNAFRPKIGKTKVGGPEIIRRHNKGCNCKRSGCLKNYCECYEAKIACTAICKCVGCRNVEETLERRHRNHLPRLLPAPPPDVPLAPKLVYKQPCSFMTTGVIEAVCQCLIASAVDNKDEPEQRVTDPMRNVIEEFARCLQDIISAAHQSTSVGLMEEEPA